MFYNILETKDRPDAAESIGGEGGGCCTHTLLHTLGLLSRRHFSYFPLLLHLHFTFQRRIKMQHDKNRTEDENEMSTRCLEAQMLQLVVPRIALHVAGRGWEEGRLVGAPGI